MFRSAQGVMKRHRDQLHQLRPTFRGRQARGPARLHLRLSSLRQHGTVCSFLAPPPIYFQLSDDALLAELQQLVSAVVGIPGHRGRADARILQGKGVLVFDEQADLPQECDDLLHLLLCPSHTLVDTLLRQRPRCPDDYVLAPAKASELVARAQLLARCGGGNLRACQLLKDFFHDPMSRRAIWRGRLADLTSRESSLLKQLAAQTGKPVERDALIHSLSPWMQDLGSNAIDVHMHGLRGKLAPELIETVRGVGYRLTAQKLD